MVQTSPGQKYLANITDLVPATSYLLRLRVIYNNTLHSFTWPRKPLFNFTTLGECVCDRFKKLVIVSELPNLGYFLLLIDIQTARYQTSFLHVYFMYP